MNTEIRVPEGEALGVVIDGERGVIYEPGMHDVQPVTADGYYRGDAEWWTVRFSTDRSTVEWRDVSDDLETNAMIDVEVTDPAAVWEQAPDLENPVLSLLETALEDALDDRIEPTELTPTMIHEYTPEDCGVQIRRLVHKQWHRTEYELETIDGQFVTLEVVDDATGTSSSPLDDTTAPALVRDALAGATDDQRSLASLDPVTINSHMTDDATLFVRNVHSKTERSER